MKMSEFLKEKKWQIISNIAFLAIFAVIAGVFAHGMDSRFNSLKDQIDQITVGISSLETSTAAMKSSADGMTLKSGKEISDRSDISDLQSKLDDILSQLSDLSKTVASIKASSEAEKQAAKLVEKTITAPDAQVPESPADPAKPDKQPISAKTLVKGQEFTITVKANNVSNLYGYQFNLNYDNKKATYKGSLKSSIKGISTIFKKDMTDHLLVGATAIGNTQGYSGQNVTVCTMVFTAAADIDPSSLTIDGVSAVDANQKYVENISGWSIDVKAN